MPRSPSAPPPLWRWIAVFFIAYFYVLAGSFAQNSGQSTAPGPGKSIVTTEQVRAELMAYAPDGVAPGKPLWVGLQLQHQPEWHTYWKNAGDSGLPTVLAWTLPPGIDAGEIAWPVPRKIRIGHLANYGYEGTVLLPVPLTVSPLFNASPLATDLDIRLKASWLVCRQECIPQEGDFSLKLPLRSTTALNRAAFDRSFAAQPKALPGDSRIDVLGQTLRLQVPGLPATLRGQSLELFPETPELIETAAAWTQAWEGSTWTASLPLAAQRSVSPERLALVLHPAREPLTGQIWRTEAPITGTWPAATQTTAVSAELQAALRAAAQGDNAMLPPAALGASLWLALLGALAGGLILNLMPCVFPVLAIKVLGFAQAATQPDARRQLRQQGLAYTVGVLLSFLALGGLLLALRAGGEQLGWGFQLQSPLMVASLAALFTLIALNLLGVFELGMLLPGELAGKQASHPLLNAGLSGVLAVAIASPCTAPFMGASLGLAVQLPAAQALLLFLALGTGMALPYLLASCLPALARWLPRPGPWMLVFRRFMAFPMLATVAWLVWVLGQQSGIDGAGTLLALLLLLAMAVWALSLPGRSRWWLGGASLAALAALASQWGPLLSTVQAPPSVQTGATPADAAGWQAWRAEHVAQLQAQGRTVFVDFTAAWCVTCQYNKKTTLADTQVLADLAAKNITLLRADWTRRDPAISAALAELGRNGVPVYVFYAPGKAPVVLSEVLSVAQMRAAIARL